MLDKGSLPLGGAKRLLADDVYRYIGAKIVRGELAPGERIRDADLALEMHVSRMPVREALQRLELIGLVKMYPSRYTEVTAVTPEVVSSSLEFAAYQSGFVARLAAVRMTDQECEGALTRIAAIVAGIDDPVESSTARRDLFNYLSAHSGNALQHDLMNQTSLALARNLQGIADEEGARERILAECDALARALREQDGDAAERACRHLHRLD